MLLRRLKVYKFTQKVPKPPAQLLPRAARFAAFLFEGAAVWSSAKAEPIFSTIAVCAWEPLGVRWGIGGSTLNSFFLFVGRAGGMM